MLMWYLTLRRGWAGLRFEPSLHDSYNKILREHVNKKQTFFKSELNYLLPKILNIFENI